VDNQGFFETFVARLPDEQANALRRLRTDILAAAPDATEGPSSRVPAFKYNGRYLASMNATKQHLSLFMMQGNVLDRLKPQLQVYHTTRVAVRFTPNHPIPSELVQTIIAERIRQIDGK
jgi:uncharacterized protein YdhG (YjbR/CyaY superfamily)